MQIGNQSIKTDTQRVKKAENKMKATMMQNNLFSDWVENFYPHYYQCNEISRWQDLDKVLSGEMEEDEAKEKNIPTCTIKIFHEYRELSETIFWKAVENFHATVCETTQIDVCRSMAGLKLNIQ